MRRSSWSSRPPSTSAITGPGSTTTHRSTRSSTTSIAARGHPLGGRHHVDRRRPGHAAGDERLPSGARAWPARRPGDRHADLLAARRVRVARTGGAVRRRPARDRADEVLRGWGADRRDGSFTTPYGPRWRVHGLPVLAVRGRVPGGDLPRPTGRLADRRPRPGRPGDRPRPRRLRGRTGGEHPRDDHRHRIEHCGGPRPDQIERMAGLGVMAVGPAALLLGRGRRLARPPSTPAGRIGCSRTARSSTPASGSPCRATRRSPRTGPWTRSLGGAAVDGLGRGRRRRIRR